MTSCAQYFRGGSNCFEYHVYICIFRIKIDWLTQYGLKHKYTTDLSIKVKSRLSCLSNFKKMTGNQHTIVQNL